MDFGDYVEAYSRDFKAKRWRGIVVSRMPGGIGILIQDPETGGPGTLQCCRRRGARVISLNGNSFSGVDSKIAEFIKDMRSRLAEGWRSGAVREAADLADYGVFIANPEVIPKRKKTRIQSGDLLDRCLPGCYGSGRRR
ncbi:MAG: hypothetical protein P4L53_04005 [Candidatus Obscuribacterales bacterium]|nr:hypothetical protein [Candidatus Obscuribacterales bacterium]